MLTAVSIALDEVGLLEGGEVDGKGFAVRRGAYGGVDVQLIDDVVGTVPPTCQPNSHPVLSTPSLPSLAHAKGGPLVQNRVRTEMSTFSFGELGIHVRRQHPVVVEVVVVAGLLRADLDLGEPLHHAAADVAGDDEADGESVVRLQEFAVLLVRQNHVLRFVHCNIDGDARPVLGSSTTCIGAQNTP